MRIGIEKQPQTKRNRDTNTRKTMFLAEGAVMNAAVIGRCDTCSAGPAGRGGGAGEPGEERGCW